MGPEPLRPARIVFAEGEPPRSPDYGDVYHPRIGAGAQARHVFLGGNGLPRRWQGREAFTVLETGFGLGQNFLATWGAWRDDPGRCGRLFVVSIEKHPPRREDLARALAGQERPELAGALVEAWPALVPGLHALDFDDGRVRLLLAFGDARRLVPRLQLRADAFYLDGFAPDRNPELWQAPLLKALARHAAPGATAATWSVARPLRDGLAAAGFSVGRAPGLGGKREITVARFEPRALARARAEPGRAPAEAARSGERRALVIGAGLAGAGVALGLSGLGWCCRVLDRHPAPAAEASGNPAGLFHGTVHAADGPHARWQRAAALQAARTLRPWLREGSVAGACEGLLRLASPEEAVETLRARQAAAGLDDRYVQALDADEASRRAGVALHAAAWCFPEGGWLSPLDWVRRALASPGVRFDGGQAIAALRQHRHGWQLLDEAGATVDEAGVVVLANAVDAARLLPAPPGWPLAVSRGQVSVAPAGLFGPSPRLPVSGGGYALTLPDGRLLFGATSDPGDGDPALRPADHHRNLVRLRRLLGPPGEAAVWHDGRAGADQALVPRLDGRVGWRLHAEDRLPVLGAVVDDALPHGGAPALTQARQLPRLPGLFVATAYGSRGITAAALAGQVLAAWIAGAPVPVETDLLDALDPGRWRVRAARRPAGRAR